MIHSPRVVLDTNVVLSALIFPRGRLGVLRGVWQSGGCQTIASSPTVRELVRALSYPKFRLSVDEQQELLADYLPFCKAVRMPARTPKLPVCRDPADRPFLELAIVGKADYLVSGDQDLLSLGTVSRCPIVSAEKFLSVMHAG